MNLWGRHARVVWGPGKHDGFVVVRTFLNFFDTVSFGGNSENRNEKPPWEGLVY